MGRGVPQPLHQPVVAVGGPRVDPQPGRRALDRVGIAPGVGLLGQGRQLAVLAPAGQGLQRPGPHRGVGILAGGGDQTGAGLGTPGLAQGAGRGGPYPGAGVVPQALDQGRHQGLVGFGGAVGGLARQPSEGLGRVVARGDVLAGLRQGHPARGGAGPGHGLGDPSAHVEVHVVRLVAGGQGKTLAALVDLQAMTGDLAADAHLHLHRRAEHLGGAAEPGLGLAHLELDEALVVPGPGEVEAGEARPVEPLLEEARQALSRDALADPLEVLGHRVAAGEALGVVLHRGPEGLVADHEAQQVQTHRRPGVDVGVEQVHRLAVARRDRRLELDAGGVGQVDVLEGAHRSPEGVDTLGGLEPQALEVAGEALVQPDVGPVVAGDQVSEPLVGRLVDDQVDAVAVTAAALVGQDQGRQGGGGDVLHAAPGEVVDAGLAVFGIGVGQADGLGQELQHPRRHVEGGLEGSPPGAARRRRSAPRPASGPGPRRTPPPPG